MQSLSWTLDKVAAEPYSETTLKMNVTHNFLSSKNLMNRELTQPVKSADCTFYIFFSITGVTQLQIHI